MSYPSRHLPHETCSRQSLSPCGAAPFTQGCLVWGTQTQFRIPHSPSQSPSVTALPEGEPRGLRMSGCAQGSLTRQHTNSIHNSEFIIHNFITPQPLRGSSLYTREPCPRTNLRLRFHRHHLPCERQGRRVQRGLFCAGALTKQMALHVPPAHCIISHSSFANFIFTSR